jgi:hypothetical protein
MDTECGMPWDMAELGSLRHKVERLDASLDRLEGELPNTVEAEVETYLSQVKWSDQFDITADTDITIR